MALKKLKYKPISQIKMKKFKNKVVHQNMVFQIHKVILLITKIKFRKFQNQRIKPLSVILFKIRLK